MVLPILEKDGHPGPHRRTMHTDVLEVAAVGMSGSSPISGVVVCETQAFEAIWELQAPEGLLELPMLGAPLNGGEHLRCKFLGLVAEC